MFSPGSLDAASSSMMSAATPSSSNSGRDFTPSSHFIPAFSTASTADKKHSRLLENDVISQSGRMHSPSFLELPTLKHVSKAFRIEIWFLSHSPGEMKLWVNYRHDLIKIILTDANHKVPFPNSISRWHDIVQWANF